MKRKTTHVLLVVIAVLLGLNLFRPTPPSQEAQAQPGIEIPVRAVALWGQNEDGGNVIVYRLWSDGLVEQIKVFDPKIACFADGWCNWMPLPE